MNKVSRKNYPINIFSHHMLEYKKYIKNNMVSDSNKSFGIVFSCVFLLIALRPVWNGNAPCYWPLSVSFIFSFLAFVIPDILTPLNSIWTKFGLLMHKVMNPFILGMIFFIILTPIALIMRVLGKLPLKLEDSDQDSYWIVRASWLTPESFMHQF